MRYWNDCMSGGYGMRGGYRNGPYGSGGRYDLTARMGLTRSSQQDDAYNMQEVNPYSRSPYGSGNNMVPYNNGGYWQQYNNMGYNMMPYNGMMPYNRGGRLTSRLGLLPCDQSCY